MLLPNSLEASKIQKSTFYVHNSSLGQQFYDQLPSNSSLKRIYFGTREKLSIDFKFICKLKCLVSFFVNYSLDI